MGTLGGWLFNILPLNRWGLYPFLLHLGGLLTALPSRILWNSCCVTSRLGHKGHAASQNTHSTGRQPSYKKTEYLETALLEKP